MENRMNNKVEKINKFKDLIVNNSHKIDLVIGLCFFIYGIYGYFYNVKYFWIFIIAGIISFIFSFIKPVKLFNNYLNNKIIKKD